MVPWEHKYMATSNSSNLSLQTPSSKSSITTLQTVIEDDDVKQISTGPVICAPDPPLFDDKPIVGFTNSWRWLCWKSKALLCRRCIWCMPQTAHDVNSVKLAKSWEAIMLFLLYCMRLMSDECITHPSIRPHAAQTASWTACEQQWLNNFWCRSLLRTT